MLDDPHNPTRTIPEPPTTKLPLFFGSIFKPKMMLSIASPGGLPEDGFHMEGVGVDVVATYEPLGSATAGLKKWSRERGTHLLVAKMRPGFAEDTAFELVYSQRQITTMIGDLALYTRGGTDWYLCPMRNDVLYFCLGKAGIEPQVSTPWSNRHERLIGFADAATLLAGAAGER